MEIAGRVFIVTGGASGLGEGTVRMLVAHGAQVVIADVQADKGAALAAALGPQSARFVRCDVTLAADGQAAVDAATSWGRLSGLVNCAGICPAAKTVGKEGPHDLDLFQRTLQVNLLGSFNMIRLAAAAMQR